MTLARLLASKAPRLLGTGSLPLARTLPPHRRSRGGSSREILGILAQDTVLLIRCVSTSTGLTRSKVIRIFAT